MPQFSNSNNNKINYSNILSGIIIFSIGLIKKIIIADGFAVFANEGFSNGFIHDFYSAWTTSISYTFQIYFDFSGYCDMAVGSALLFNIKLPINFNSPYKATDIQDFWRRWHITLGRYLRDYIYIPLGGNRVSNFRNYLNLFITFAIAGLWHGASWLFILWGALHGAALIIHRIWSKSGIKLFKPLSWFITFMFINSSWVFFRSENINQALEILSKMLSFSEAKKIPLEGLPLVDLIRYGNLAGLVAEKISFGIAAHLTFLIMSSISFYICTRKNSQEIAINTEIGYSKITRYAIFSSIATYLSLHSESAVFLYFNF
ncbi:poly(beta-D-mannuronate) O-acetylase [Erwinia billingiae]|nr:poly(beta-D-mannuronate) O-acetylase [Erwinia billingiae]